MSIITDLRDQWAAYLDTAILFLPKLILAVIVVIIFELIARFSRKYFIKFLRTRTEDQLVVNFINNVLQITNYILGFLLFLYVTGHTKIAASIAGTAGVSAIILGFAFRDLGENFIAGVLMAFDRPFRIGDTVETGAVEGKIVSMTMRQTHIKSFDGKDVFVPNGQILKNPLYNHTLDGFMRYGFTIEVDNQIDFDKAIEAITQVIQNTPGVLTQQKAPSIKVANLKANTADIQVLYWVNTFDERYGALQVKHHAITHSVEALRKQHIDLPSTVIEIKNT